MPDIWLKVSDRERREIEKLAAVQGEVIGNVGAVSVEEMAGSLLSAHLILIRDCGGILPEAKPAPGARSRKSASKVMGKGGVSLSGGKNG